jgi:hypothetical protein
MNELEVRNTIIEEEDGAEIIAIMDSISHLFAKNPTAVVKVAISALSSALQAIKDDKSRTAIQENIFSLIRALANKK